ncbi:MAG: ribonuclease T2 [Neomegalonema sp.]|nr:ribonuclease T2 [Neomegalonema sp.]
MSRSEHNGRGGGPAVRRSGTRRRQDTDAMVSRRGERRERAPSGKSSGGALAQLIAIGVAVLVGGAGVLSQLDLGGEHGESSKRVEVKTRAADRDATEVEYSGNRRSADERLDRPADRRSSDRSAARFDYYVLAMSWSPTFCRTRPRSIQCGRGARFVLHGLWPQFEEGWPQNCETPHRRPSRELLRRFRHLNPDTGLLSYQWRKHGSCSGLSPAGYLEAASKAMALVKTPKELKSFSSDTRMDPKVIETAVIRANPALKRDGVTVKCRRGSFSEIRVCFTRDLKPRRCGRDALRDCGARNLLLPAPR